MFENKAFYVEMVDKRDSASTQPRDPDKFRKDFTYVAVVVVGVAGALIGLKTMSDVIINTTKS